MPSASFVPAAVAACLLTVSACATAVSPRADLLGTPAPPTAATRTVDLGNGVRYVNVTSGDTVRFQGQGSEFAWSFDTSPIVAVFDLNQVAPPGTLGREVRVYVAPNPMYNIRTEWDGSSAYGGSHRAR